VTVDVYNRDVRGDRPTKEPNADVSRGTKEIGNDLDNLFRFVFENRAISKQ